MYVIIGKKLKLLLDDKGDYDTHVSQCPEIPVLSVATKSVATASTHDQRRAPCKPVCPAGGFCLFGLVHESRIESQRREGEHAKEKKGRYSVLAVAGGRCTLVQGLVPYSETCIGRLGFGNNLDLHVPQIVDLVKEIKTCIV